MSFSRSAIASSSRGSRVVARTHTVNLLPTRIPRRYYAASPESPSPSPKIVCVPFGQKPEDVISKLNNYGLIASARWYHILYAGLLRIFGEGIAPLAREFGMGEKFHMKDMKAAYYPVWRVDVVLDGVLVSSKDSISSKAWIAIKEGYVPGNAFAPLSYISYAVPPLSDEIPPYNPSKDLHQLGEGYDIVPIPFTTSPLSVLAKIRQLIGRRTDWQGFKVDESKWKETMVACYPIMFPIYIAEFEDTAGDKARRFNVILDAHDKNLAMCRATFSPPPWLRSEGRMDKDYFANPGPFLPLTEMGISAPPPETHEENPSSGIRIVRESPKDESNLLKTLVETYQRWLSPPPVVPSEVDVLTPSPLSEVEQRVDWDDVRIQSWSGVEREENGEYVERGGTLRKTIDAMELTAKIDREMPGDTAVKTITMSPRSGFIPQVGNKLLSEIREEREETLKNLKKDLEDLKPSWLKVKAETSRQDK